MTEDFEKHETIFGGKHICCEATGGSTLWWSFRTLNWKCAGCVIYSSLVLLIEKWIVSNTIGITRPAHFQFSVLKPQNSVLPQLYWFKYPYFRLQGSVRLWLVHDWTFWKARNLIWRQTYLLWYQWRKHVICWGFRTLNWKCAWNQDNTLFQFCVAHKFISQWVDWSCSQTLCKCSGNVTMSEANSPSHDRLRSAHFVYWTSNPLVVFSTNTGGLLH